MKCIAKYLLVNGVDEGLIVDKATSSLSASIDCHALIENKLQHAYEKREDEAKASSDYNEAFTPCLFRRMRLDDNVKRVYLQREAIKMNFRILGPAKQRRLSELLENTKKIQHNHYEVCEAMNGKF